MVRWIPNPQEPFVKTTDIVRICIAVATLALGMTAYSLIVALQYAAV
jgi:hypothetical protein